MLMIKTCLYCHLVSFRGGSSLRTSTRVHLPLLLGFFGGVLGLGGGGGVFWGFLWFFFNDTDFKALMCSFTFRTLIYLMVKKKPKLLVEQRTYLKMLGFLLIAECL